jgi:hypothetical protein
VSLLSEVLVISGVAMDLVGATVLSHAHNAESMVDIREEIGAVAAFNNVSLPQPAHAGASAAQPSASLTAPHLARRHEGEGGGEGYVRADGGAYACHRGAARRLGE